MRKFLIAAASVAALATAAIAMDDPMAGTYGNKVITTNAKGEKTTFWFAKGGAYKVKTFDNKDGTGKWVIKDGKFCITADMPAGKPAAAETCSPFVGGGKKAGDNWTQKDGTGADIKVEIVAGM